MFEAAGYALAALAFGLLFWWSRLVSPKPVGGLPKAPADGEMLAPESDLEALLAACGASVLFTGHDGDIRRANAAARQVFAPAGGDLVGKTVFAATLSADLDALLECARRSGGAERAEVRLPGPAGTILAATVAPVSPESPVSSFVVVAQNISEIRRLETIRRDFVANVSHELRTPLASIRAMAETLRDGARTDDDVADRFLDSIVAESERLTRIADDLIVLSGAESQVPEPNPVDVGELLKAVVDRLREGAIRGGIALDMLAPPGLRVLSNADKLEQVAVNLIENAIKYTPPGGTVRVEAENREEMVCIRVADTGIGILQEHLPRLFERFYRVDKARSRQSGGTGLGLAIVKNIVEAYGGRVRVESELNRGSVFEVFLPSASAEVPAAEECPAVPHSLAR